MSLTISKELGNSKIKLSSFGIGSCKINLSSFQEASKRTLFCASILISLRASHCP